MGGGRHNGFITRMNPDIYWRRFWCKAALTEAVCGGGVPAGVHAVIMAHFLQHQGHISLYISFTFWELCVLDDHHAAGEARCAGILFYPYCVSVLRLSITCVACLCCASVLCVSVVR